MEDKLKNLEGKIHLHGEELEQCKTEVGQQIEAANFRLQSMEEKQEKTDKKVDSVIEILKVIKSGVKFFYYAGIVARWIALTITAIVATYVALKDYLS